MSLQCIFVQVKCFKMSPFQRDFQFWEHEKDTAKVGQYSGFSITDTYANITAKSSVWEGVLSITKSTYPSNGL